MTRSETIAVLEQLTPEQHRWLAGLPASESAFVLQIMHTLDARVVSAVDAAYNPSQAAA